MYLGNLIGTTIKKCRCENNISQLELEYLANISTGTISRIENGHIMPALETLIKIIKTLNIDYTDVIQMLGLAAVTQISNGIEANNSFQQSRL